MDELSEFVETNIPYVVGESVKVIDVPFNGFNELSKTMIKRKS